MEPSAGVIVADRFRLVQPLGQGGMGAVWMAQHTGLDVPCALKFIHDEAAKSPDLRARFEREAKAAAQLRSPNVVQILDHGVWEGKPYIAMELLEGEDLARRLHKRRPLSPRETLSIASQVGRALTKAHAVGLVHRDLKPANIFLVQDDEQEIAKVLDFGVAKIKETGVADTTQTGMVLGTPYYMSPEQARGSRDIDHRSDLWALAVVVFQCVVGKLPFRGEALGDIFVKIIVEPLPVPSVMAGAAGVPPGFDAWWARAASRDPAERFQTPKAFTDALALAFGLTVPGMDTRPSLSGSAVAPPLPAGVPPVAPASPVAQIPFVPVPTLPLALAPQAADEGDAPTRAMPGLPSVALVAPEVAPPTPLQQSLSVSVAPRSGRVGIYGAILAGVVAVSGLGVFLAVRSGPSGATHPAASAPDPAPTAPAAVSAAPTVDAPAAAPTGAAAATSAPAPSSAPADAGSSASHPAAGDLPAQSHPPAPQASAETRAHEAAPTAKPAVAAPAPHRKTDFGF